VLFEIVDEQAVAREFGWLNAIEFGEDPAKGVPVVELFATFGADSR